MPMRNPSSDPGCSPWIEPTTGYWQSFEPAGAYREAPWRFGYPAPLDVVNGLAAFMAELARPLGADIAGVVVAMLQGTRWRETLGTRAGMVRGVYASPRLVLREDGWYPE